jgi:transcriptional regulator with XRE-family HTH domain
MNDLQTAFGDHLKSLRKVSGMTQEKLAEKCGLSVQYLGDVERGKANPTLAILEKIGKALDISIVELFDIEDFQADTEELRESIQNHVAKADNETLRRLYGVIRAISR